MLIPMHVCTNTNIIMTNISHNNLHYMHIHVTFWAFMKEQNLGLLQYFYIKYLKLHINNGYSVNFFSYKPKLNFALIAWNSNLNRRHFII